MDLQLLQYLILLVREREGNQGIRFSVKLIELNYQSISLKPKSSSITFRSLEVSESPPGGIIKH